MMWIILYHGEDDFWVVKCLSLPGCVGQGRTKQEAISNIKEAIDLYIKALDSNKPVLQDRL